MAKVPNNKGKMAILVIGALVFFSVGFVGGQITKALVTLPGDTSNPVATQSYVEATVGEKVAALSLEIEELEAEIAALKGTGVTTDSTTDDTGSSTTTTTTTTTTTANTLTVTGETVNLRAEASTSSEILASMKKGDTVTKISEENDWIKVTYGSLTGYVAGYLVE